MACVWPPQTSISASSRPGGIVSASSAASARASSPERNSSTYLMRPSRGAFPARADLRLLALVGLAHVTEELQRLSRLFLVEAVEREADVHEHPLAHLRLALEQRTGDDAAHAADLGLGRLGAGVDDLDDLGWNS